jgi:hypothetical protein
MNRILTFIVAALMLSAPALAQTVQRKIYTEKPVGDGEPGAISCYPSPSSLSLIRKLECRPNSEWASIYAAQNRATRIDNGKMGVGPVNTMH